MRLNFEETGWMVIEGHTEEYRYEIRFREFTEKPITEQYCQRLNIFWEMSEFFENGFPTEAVLDKLHAFEDRQINAVEFDKFSIMSMVLTGNREREIVFHTPDPQEFIRRLTEMPQEVERYPIQINLNEDSSWSYYYDELAKVKNA